MELVIAIEDPQAGDVRALLATHLEFSRGVTPIEFSFALDIEQLIDRAVTFFTARGHGRLVGVAALKRLDENHSELKSMHTRQSERGQGVGRALVAHVLKFATDQGYRRVSLETGTTEEFAAARTLYAKCGFVPAGPFGSYQPSEYNTFFTLHLEPQPPE